MRSVNIQQDPFEPLWKRSQRAEDSSNCAGSRVDSSTGASDTFFQEPSGDPSSRDLGPIRTMVQPDSVQTRLGVLAGH